MLDEGLLAGAIAGELTMQLRNGLMALVEHDEEVVREVVEQRVRRFAGFPSVDRARVVLDAVAVAEFLHHLEVVLGAHAEPLRLEELALLLELGQLLLELVLDPHHGPLQPLGTGHVVRGGEHDELLELGDLLAGDRIDHEDALDLVAEQLDADRGLVIGRMQLDGVAPHPELAAHEVHVVALVLHVHQSTEDRPLIVGLARSHDEELVLVLQRRTEAVDARDRGDDDGVASGEQRGGRGVAQAIDLVVDRGVLLDERVRGRHVGLGLVVVVVGHEVLHPVLGEELLELVGELRGERLVGGDHESGTLECLDRPGDGGALARAGDAEQRLEPVAGLDARGELLDGLGLIAGGREFGDQTERRHGDQCTEARAV